MTSIFSKIGEALRPEPQARPAPARGRQKTSGNNMLKRLLGYFAGGCAADKSGLQQEEAFLGGLQPEGVLTRRSYAKGMPVKHAYPGDRTFRGVGHHPMNQA